MGEVVECNREELRQEIEVGEKTVRQEMGIIHELRDMRWV